MAIHTYIHIYKHTHIYTCIHTHTHLCCCLVTKSCLTLLRPHGLYSPLGSFCPWDFPGKNNGVGCHFVLQGSFLTQGSNPNLLHWQVGSLPLAPSGKPYIYTNKCLCTEEPGRLQSMGSLRVRHDWATSLSLFTFMHWRRKWQLTPVFWPGESQGRGSLVGYHLWGYTESDTTEVT